MFRLIIITVVLVLVGSGVYVAYTNPSILPSQLRSYTPVLKSSIDSGIQGIQTAMSKGKNAQPIVLGVQTETSRIFQADTSGKPIHQKAMEYTQYQYCKMVVNSYENGQNTPPTTLTPTPSPDKE